MPDPAPQPQEQPPQVPRPPQDAVVQSIVASATPAGDTPTTPGRRVVHVVLAFPLYFYTFLFCTSAERFISRPLSSWSFLRFVAPFINFMILFGFFILIPYFWSVASASFYPPFSSLLSFRQFCASFVTACSLHFCMFIVVSHLFASPLL